MSRPKDTEWQHRGVADYSTDTLLLISRDLRKNPQSRIATTWEYGRLRAVSRELRKRQDQYK